MIPQTSELQNYDQKVRQIRAQVSAVMRKRGLLPRFKRWRLTEDPATGMVVLFGVLNNRYIATHTAIPSCDYVDSQLLHELSDELKMEVVTSNSDDLRYAFILSRGRVENEPENMDQPFLAGEIF